jgi:hypothetical protein
MVSISATSFSPCDRINTSRQYHNSTSRSAFHQVPASTCKDDHLGGRYIPEILLLARIDDVFAVGAIDDGLLKKR